MRGGSIELRLSTRADLEHNFEHQRDPEARWMLGFGAQDPNDRETYLANWEKHLANPEITIWAICLFEAGTQPEKSAGIVVGSMQTFRRTADGPIEVGYQVARPYWGRGIASAALAEALRRTIERPVCARCIAGNGASSHILEKQGFKEYGREVNFGPARGELVEERLFRLDGA